MELKIGISGIQESERLLSIIQLGLVSALEEEVISIEEAEGFLFNLYTIEKLKMYGFSEDLIGIIKEGCELEDVKSLVPEKLILNITRLKKQILNNISSSQTPILPIEKIVK
jgi:hypothetical protein